VEDSGDRAVLPLACLMYCLFSGIWASAERGAPASIGRAFIAALGASLLVMYIASWVMEKGKE